MFQTRLTLDDTDDPDIWAVRLPLGWQDATYGTLIVPAGTLTDLASIPRFLRSLPTFDPNGPSRRPAVMHDWLYADGKRGKAFADAFLRDALLSVGVGSKAAAAYYYAVRWFADAAWREHRARDPR